MALIKRVEVDLTEAQILHVEQAIDLEQKVRGIAHYDKAQGLMLLLPEVGHPYVACTSGRLFRFVSEDKAHAQKLATAFFHKLQGV